MAVAVGTSLDDGNVVGFAREVQTSKGTKRGASSGTYRSKSVGAISTQKGIVKIGSLGVKEYRPELTAILAGEL
jgi:hypothetical protein